MKTLLGKILIYTCLGLLLSCKQEVITKEDTPSTTSNMKEQKGWINQLPPGVWPCLNHKQIYSYFQSDLTLIESDLKRAGFKKGIDYNVLNNNTDTKSAQEFSKSKPVVTYTVRQDKSFCMVSVSSKGKNNLEQAKKIIANISETISENNESLNHINQGLNKVEARYAQPVSSNYASVLVLLDGYILSIERKANSEQYKFHLVKNSVFSPTLAISNITSTNVAQALSKRQVKIITEYDAQQRIGSSLYGTLFFPLPEDVYFIKKMNQEMGEGHLHLVHNDFNSPELIQINYQFIKTSGLFENPSRDIHMTELSRNVILAMGDLVCHSTSEQKRYEQMLDRFLSEAIKQDQQEKGEDVLVKEQINGHLIRMVYRPRNDVTSYYFIVEKI